MYSYFEIDDMIYTLVTAGTDKCPGPVELPDRWTDLPHLTKVADYLHGWEEINQDRRHDKKQLQLTQADLVPHTGHSFV